MEDIQKEVEEVVVEGAETPDTSAEKKSVDSVKAAANGGKSASKRSGDNSNGQKTELDNKAKDAGTDEGKAVTSKTDLPGTSGYDKAAKYPSLKKEDTYGAELDALVESEATLSEEFKEKTAVIFEAALKTKLSEEIDRLEESYATQLAEEKTSIKEELTAKVDSYLDLVVESWMEENKLAVQNGLRAEIAENFMTKLKDVFTESYISVPAEKEDLVDGLVEQVEALETEVNSVTKTNMEISEELKAYKREMIIRESARGLADTQVEKLNSLVADIDFVAEDTFASKVKTIRESFFAEKAPAVIEESVEEETTQEVVTSSIMEAYVKALKK